MALQPGPSDLGVGATTCSTQSLDGGCILKIGSAVTLLALCCYALDVTRAPSYDLDITFLAASPQTRIQTGSPWTLPHIQRQTNVCRLPSLQLSAYPPAQPPTPAPQLGRRGMSCGPKPLCYPSHRRCRAAFATVRPSWPTPSDHHDQLYDPFLKNPFG